MQVNVKNTIPHRLAELLAPHYCGSCGQIGSLLCDGCKYDIVSDTPQQCLACLRLVGRYGDVCKGCEVAYTKGWFVGLHQSAVRQLVNNYKFNRVQWSGGVLAGLLHASLPELPTDTIVVPVPTIAPHIRERGYDHAATIAHSFARLRQLPYRADLLRNGATTQRGVGRSQRLRQAANAFYCHKALAGRYLLVDDVCTTGATVACAAKALRQAGANEVWVAVISREPLD